MQQGLSKIEDAGARLVALSYDEPEALRAFSERFDITYPLLSDPDSLIIGEFGILNTLIDETDHPWFGIPFPGAYVTDADGIIRSKFFESHLALRSGAEQLARAAGGSVNRLPEYPEPPDRTASPSTGEVTCEITIDDEPMAPGVLRELLIRLRVPAGKHLYGRPVPTGMVATTVDVDDGQHLIVRPTAMPPTRTHILAGTGEELQVFDGDVELRVPFTHSAPLAGRSVDDNQQSGLTISGTVRWQSCDDETCDLPASKPFSFTVATAGIVRNGRGSDKGEMDTRALLHRMTARRAQ